MEWSSTTSAMILGILLRVAIPLIVTFLIVYFLKRLDERWKTQSDIEGSPLVKAGNEGCWEFNNCPEEERAVCKAFQNPDTPCWQVFRETNGRLQEQCIGCDVFRHAPVPITT
jgi:hypothetical protein